MARSLTASDAGCVSFETGGRRNARADQTDCLAIQWFSLRGVMPPDQADS